MNLIEEMRIDKTKFEILQSFEEARIADRKFWLSRTIEERFEAIEIMRQINYDYDPVNDRIQRVFQIITLPHTY